MGAARERRPPHSGARVVIARADIVQRVAEWGLREDVVEKDYILGWVLSGIGAHPVLGQHWVFKGGTCLKKCYIETYRFSEDLDFTVLPGGPVEPDAVLPLMLDVLRNVGEQSGIDFAIREPRFRTRPAGTSVEGRVFYQGPRLAPAASIKLDLTADERVVRPPVLRTIAHPFPDDLANTTVRCYSFEEVFAEKIRAMGQRGRPRDLYDVINLFRRDDLRLHPELIRDVLAEKCAAKSIPVPTVALVMEPARRAELEAEWENMLGHQLLALPPLEQFLEELPTVFGWLEGTVEIAAARAFPVGASEDATWTPPPTVASWGTGVPLEVIRFAAANHLLVELAYQGSWRLIEPYSLRMTRDGNLLLHAIRADSAQHRTYSVSQIQGVRATTTPFHPRFAIEFSTAGPMAAPPARSPSPRPRAPRAGRSGRPRHRYIVECPHCNRHFERTTRNTALRAHKDRSGFPCSGRRGQLVDTFYA
jgi:predicted nucleotidyltransferase component of viral defense system